MDQTYHDISQELGDIPAIVCLEHGRFIPCRSPEPHRTSTDPADVEKVRYHNEVSVRLQPKPPPPPVYRKVTDCPAEEWPYYLGEEYGSVIMYCGGQVLGHTTFRTAAARYLISCRETFSASNPGELLQVVRQHLLDTQHHEQQRG